MEDNKKNEIVKAMTEIEFYPEVAIDTIEQKPSFKLPIEDLTALGVAIKPLTAAIQTVLTGSDGGSGIYFVNTMGKKMFQANNGTGFIGSLKNSVGAVGGGQARHMALPCDPTMLFVAMALKQIERKLDTIQETQMKILEFLEEDKKSKLTANLNFLSDEIGRYKFSYDDSTYINATLTTIQMIRKDAGADIEFYRKKIQSPLEKKSFFTKDKEIKDRLNEIRSNFKYYQMAVYVFAFASFFEMMLQKNFKSDHLEHIAQAIRDKSVQYRELYTTCYTKLEDLADSTIQTHLLGGLAGANKMAGKAISKVPVIEKGPVDEGLIALGNKLDNTNIKKTGKIIDAFISCKDDYVNTFTDYIDNVNELYNTPTQVCFDNENIYYLRESDESIREE